MMKTRSIRRFLLAAIVAASLIAGAAATTSPVMACPNCKETLPDGEAGSGGSNVAGGYAWSVVFMLAVPFTLAAVFGGAVYFTLRKANATPTGRDV